MWMNIYSYLINNIIQGGKDMFKKFLASATVAAMLTGMLGMTAFAAEWDTNGGKATVEGEGTMVEPTIQVTLPGDLAFGLNPLYLDADGDTTTKGDDTQIVTGQYVIANYSNVDVLIKAKTKAEAGQTSSAVLVAHDAEPTFNAKSFELEPVTDKKNVWLVQLLPTAAATVDSEQNVTLKFTAPKAASGALPEQAKISGITLDGTEQEVLFKLTKYDFAADKLPATSVSGFAFGGAVDPDSTFADGDIKVTTVFTLNTLTDNQSKTLYKTSTLNTAAGVKLDATVVEEVK